MTREMTGDEIRDLRAKLLNMCEGNSPYDNIQALSEAIGTIVLQRAPNLAEALSVIDGVAMTMRDGLWHCAKERWPHDPRSEEPPSVRSGFWNSKH